MQPITLIPWNADFMVELADLIAARPDFSSLTVIFPHNRPRRYLKKLLATHPALERPVFLPRMTSVAEFVADLRRELSPVPVSPANRLDLVELLHATVNTLRTGEYGLLAELPAMDREAFFPWGMRLAALLEDLLRQNVEPGGLKYMQGEVADYAAALLEQLDRIYAAYTTALFERGWTTPGLDWRFAVTHLDAIRAHLGNSTVIAAGFYALGGAEDLFFRSLWESGQLLPLWHSDPALTTGEKAHWATTEHQAWMTRWHVRPELASTSTTRTNPPEVRFCEGFDRHSQLAALNTDLAEPESLDDAAVILPDEGALLPVLHHLPVEPPNISMGYPLERTGLARLIESILTLQETRLKDGRCHWKSVTGLIRHPWLRMLGPEDKPLRKLFQVWEGEIRTGSRHFHPLAWEPPYDEPVLEGVNRHTAEPLRQEIMHHCVTAFTGLETLDQLADSLSGLAAMLHRHGESLWHTYLMDAECLFRLTTSVIPALKSAEAASEHYPRRVLFSMLRQLLHAERVSFEPDPLGGLQVLGVLETRLLRFGKIFLLDAVEERLPGTNPFDPLLPDPLRKLLGLPDSRERDNVAGYNFYRLLMGAEQAVIYYQSGIQPGLLDSKSVRSRFVEQLLWEREKKAKRLLEKDTSVFRTVTFPASAIPTDTRAVPVTPAIRSALRDKLETRGLSPSSLDQYLNCPLRFFLGYLGGLRPMEKIDEDGDRSAFGSLLHEVLRDCFLPWKGRTVTPANMDPAPILADFETALRQSDFFEQLPFDTRAALLRTGRFRLARFLESQEPATLIGLETSMETSLRADGLTIPFKGQLDRIEKREDGIHVLDYKTGQGGLPTKGFWEDMDLWERLADPEDDTALLADLARSVVSVQLPAYCHLYAANHDLRPHDAGLVLMGRNGDIKWLFGSKWTEEERDEAVLSMTPRLLNFLVNHMLGAEEFRATPGRTCQWCDFKGTCGQ